MYFTKPCFMTIRVLLVIFAIMLMTQACVQTKVLTKDTSHTIQQNATVLLMPIDIELSELTAGGLNEVRADWTLAAQDHVAANIADNLANRRADMKAYKKPDDQEIAHKHGQLVKLHSAVGGTIFMYSMAPVTQPPTKQDSFEWSLGDSAIELGELYNADYALFVYLRDSYATAGRKAAIVAAAVFGVGIPGGMQIGFATLVDLKDGNIVWFNRLFNQTGDLRSIEPAAIAVNNLLNEFPL